MKQRLSAPSYPKYIAGVARALTPTFARPSPLSASNIAVQRSDDAHIAVPSLANDATTQRARVLPRQNDPRVDARLVKDVVAGESAGGGGAGDVVEADGALRGRGQGGGPRRRGEGGAQGACGAREARRRVRGREEGEGRAEGQEDEARQKQGDGEDRLEVAREDGEGREEDERDCGRQDGGEGGGRLCGGARGAKVLGRARRHC